MEDKIMLTRIVADYTEMMEQLSIINPIGTRTPTFYSRLDRYQEVIEWALKLIGDPEGGHFVSAEIKSGDEVLTRATKWVKTRGT